MRLLPMTSVSYHEYHPNKFWSVAASENMKVCDYFIYFTMTHIQEQRFAGIIQCCNKTFLCMTHPIAEADCIHGEAPTVGCRRKTRMALLVLDLPLVKPDCCVQRCALSRDCSRARCVTRLYTRGVQFEHKF